MAGTVKNLRTLLQFRRDTAEAWEAVKDTCILAAGEPAVVLSGDDKFRFKIGDGVNIWGDLPYVNSIGGSTEVKVDSHTIILNAAGEIAINGFSDAVVGYVPSKGSDGSLVWVPLPSDYSADISALTTKVDKNTNDIVEIRAIIDETNTKLINDYYTKEQVDAKMTSAYTPGETVIDVTALPSPPTEVDIGVVHPIEQDSVTTDDFINPGQEIPGGSQVVAIKQPDGTIKYDVLPAGTVNYTELLDKIEANTQNITKNTNNIAKNIQVIDNVRLDLLNNHYTKPEIDSKIGSIYTPVPSVPDVASLPNLTDETTKPGIVIPVINAGATTNDFVDGAGQEVPAGSQVVVVEDNGVKKYDILPSPVVPDLSNYATSDQLSEGLATKVSSITAGGTTVLTKADGTVDIPIASQTQLGLVKTNEAINGVTVNSDGSMIVNKIGLDTIEQGDTVLELNGGGANG